MNRVLRTLTGFFGLRASLCACVREGQDGCARCAGSGVLLG